MDDQDFYVVGSYHTSYEANVVQTLLESNGVESQVINEDVNFLYPLMNSSNFGVRVIANIDDKEKIENILASGFDANDMI